MKSFTEEVKGQSGFSMQDSSWTDIRCPFEKRRDATAVFWDNVVYILGGSQLFPIKRMDCYNVLKDSWYSKLGPPTPRDSLAACAAQGKIYTSGGSEVGEQREVGDLVSGNRRVQGGLYFLYYFLGLLRYRELLMDEMPFLQISNCGAWHCACVTTGSSALDLFECYDTRTESWQVKTSMLMARCSHGSVEANGLIYVCGGTVGNNLSGRVLNNCEVYDPSTQQ